MFLLKLSYDFAFFVLFYKKTWKYCGKSDRFSRGVVCR
jgi:hypothetical protein